MLRKPSDPRLSNPKGLSEEGGALERPTTSLTDLLLRLGGLVFIDAVALWFAYRLFSNGAVVIGGLILFITLLVNVIFLFNGLYPWRWLTPGLALLILMVVYPVVYMVYIAFTNYGDGHLLTKEQVVAQLGTQYFSGEVGATYKWTAFRSDDGRFLIHLEDQQGNTFVASKENGIRPATPELLGGAPVGGDLPEQMNGYQQLKRLQVLRYLGELNKLGITGEEGPLRFNSLDSASIQQRKYTYDPATDQLRNNETGKVYTPKDGFFTAPNGERVTPGFAAVVGWRNFARIFTSPEIRQPFLGVFVWTVLFALLSVLTTFSLGLAMAMVLNDKQLPVRGLWRSLIIIPYTIPAFISALIWVGLFNTVHGPINKALESLFGISPDWFSDANLAKIMILAINLWLGFPYMMIICLGALQSIPSDMYEAADLDGAGPIQKFRSLTLPLLLVAVAPLLVGAFAFNFNNFTLIELVTEGNPPDPNGASVAGQTDILISYTYRLAFASGRGTDFGLAAAISLIIFMIVAAITIFNFRLTRKLEEVT